MVVAIEYSVDFKKICKVHCVYRQDRYELESIEMLCLMWQDFSVAFILTSALCQRQKLL